MDLSPFPPSKAIPMKASSQVSQKSWLLGKELFPAQAEEKREECLFAVIFD